MIEIDTETVSENALDVENKEEGVKLIQKEMYFSDAIVYKWKNIKESDTD